MEQWRVIGCPRCNYFYGSKDHNCKRCKGTGEISFRGSHDLRHKDTPTNTFEWRVGRVCNAHTQLRKSKMTEEKALGSSELDPTKAFIKTTPEKLICDAHHEFSGGLVTILTAEQWEQRLANWQPQGYYEGKEP